MQDVVIRAEDCGDEDGILLTEEESQAMQNTLAERLAGRYIIKALKDRETKKTLAPAGELITDEKSRELKKTAKLKEALVRSPFACKLVRGICQKCYGYDLAYNKLIKIGTAVGIIAAQSIGEPGTQLTMRTFHTGGVAGADITQGLPRVDELFEARPPKRKAFISDYDGKVSVEEIARTIKSEDGTTVINIPLGQKTVRIAYKEMEEDVYKLLDTNGKPLKGSIKVKEGSKVKKGDILFEADERKKKIKAKQAGDVRLEKNKIILIANANKIAEYLIPPGYSLSVKDGDLVTKGDVLTDGSIDLHQLYLYKGKEEVRKYILKEIQHIYTTQAGTKLADKHIEVVIRQLFSRVYINDPGDTDLLPGETAELSEALMANEKMRKAGKKEAQYHELFLGISKVSLSNNSFLSAASFQETQKVLINAACTGKIDPLEGLKENVIIGRLIPAGTGYIDTPEKK